MAAATPDARRRRQARSTRGACSSWRSTQRTTRCSRQPSAVTAGSCPGWPDCGCRRASRSFSPRAATGSGPSACPARDRVEIAPFDAATSAAHLRRYRADAPDADVAEFHARTDGNPRAQYYALTRAAEDGRDMPALLEACARTPEAMFAELVDSGLEVSGAGAGGRRWLALMLALARPVSTSTLAAALGVDPAAVIAFAHGLAPGVTLAGEAIQFRDEDFETYVRGRVDPSDVAEAHNRLADMFLASRAATRTRRLTSQTICSPRAGWTRCCSSSLTRTGPRRSRTGSGGQQAQSRRLDLAARAAAATGDALSAVRVAVRACDTASRLDTLSSLVESRLDLVARYTDVDLLRGYALRQSSRNGWLAPVHMRLAAALSRDPARQRCGTCRAGTRRGVAAAVDDRSKEETRGWSVGPDDAACAAEARYRLDGLDAAIDEIDRWRPSEFASDVGGGACRPRCCGRGRGRSGTRSARARCAAAEQAPFLAYAASPAAVPDRGWVDEVLAALLAADPGQEQPWHSLLIDVAARHGDRGSAAALAQRWARPLPSHRWGFRSGDADGVAALRARAVAASPQRDRPRHRRPCPAVPAAKNQQPGKAARAADGRSRGHERREWAETVRPLLDAALLAAGAGRRCGRGRGGRVRRPPQSPTDREGRAPVVYLRQLLPGVGRMVADAAIDAAAGPELIEQLAGAAPALLRDGAPGLWLDLAAGLTRHGGHLDRAADLCRQAAARARSGRVPGGGTARPARPSRRDRRRRRTRTGEAAVRPGGRRGDRDQRRRRPAARRVRRPGQPGRARPG